MDSHHRYHLNGHYVSRRHESALDRHPGPDIWIGHVHAGQPAGRHRPGLGYRGNYNARTDSTRLISAHGNLDGLVDEIILYQAPLLLGSQARPLFDLPIDAMANKVTLRLLDQRQIGDDLRLILRPDY